MRRLSKISFLVGIVSFVLLLTLGSFLSLLNLPYDEVRWEYEMILGAVLQYGTYIAIALGIIFRLLSSSPVIPKSGIVIETNAALEEDFNFWRKANTLGFFAWFPASLSMVFLFDSGPSSAGLVILGLQQIALPVAAICFFVGVRKAKVDLNSAVAYLKIPFYYGLLAIGIIAVFLISGT